MPLLGKDTSFYALLEGQAQSVCAAAQTFQSLCSDLPNADNYLQKAEKLKRDTHGQTQQVLDKADAAFVTPLDKDDLYALTTALNDIADRVENVITRLGLYKLKESNPEIRNLAELMIQCADALHDAVGGLRHMHGRDAVHPALVRIREGRAQANKTIGNAVGALLDNSSDPMATIKWKDVYDRIEMAFDLCNSAANVMENVVIKYA